MVKLDQELSTEEVPQISIHDIYGILYCSIMKVEGAVKNKRLHILIYFESTHNFLDVVVVEILECDFKEINSMKVVVSNGNVMNCIKICKQSQWSMRG